MTQSPPNTRDHVLFYLNGQPVQASGHDATLVLTDFLRRRRGLTGTKVVCAEGDCGACTVLVGRPDCGRLTYLPIDACIQFVYQLDRTHVLTVDALAEPGRLHPVQDAMVCCHGSQCGFCTPGFVMSMAGLCEQGDLSEPAMRYGVSGNLCRCTGYVQIVEAGAATDVTSASPLNERFDPKPMLDDFTGVAPVPFLVETDEQRVYGPSDLTDAVRFRTEHPGCTLVSGATDLGVRHNHGQHVGDTVLCMTGVRGFDAIDHTNGVLSLGAGATWSRIEAAVQHAVPEYHRVLTVFGSPQIRHAGTIGGNLANASPIADSLPFHYVCESEIELASVRGTRRVPIRDFYVGYKTLDMADDELITTVHTPLPADHQVLKLYKISRRRDMDISTFTAGVLLDIENETITRARIAFGGVAPTVVRLDQTEAFLQGKPIEEATFAEAGTVARGEVSPITDVRGSADFRLQLAENILLRAYFDAFAVEEAVS